jgi:hypothetical protein
VLVKTAATVPYVSVCVSASVVRALGQQAAGRGSRRVHARKTPSRRARGFHWLLTKLLSTSSGQVACIASVRACRHGQGAQRVHATRPRADADVRTRWRRPVLIQSSSCPLRRALLPLPVTRCICMHAPNSPAWGWRGRVARAFVLVLQQTLRFWFRFGKPVLPSRPSRARACTACMRNCGCGLSDSHTSLLTICCSCCICLLFHSVHAQFFSATNDAADYQLLLCTFGVEIVPSQHTSLGFWTLIT